MQGGGGVGNIHISEVARVKSRALAREELLLAQCPWVDFTLLGCRALGLGKLIHELLQLTLGHFHAWCRFLLLHRALLLDKHRLRCLSLQELLLILLALTKLLVLDAEAELTLVAAWRVHVGLAARRVQRYVAGASLHLTQALPVIEASRLLLHLLRVLQVLLNLLLQKQLLLLEVMGCCGA